MARKAKFTVEAGRQIRRNGKPFFEIGRVTDGDPWPCEVDELVHIVAALLNRLGNREIKTTYLDNETLKLRPEKAA